MKIIHPCNFTLLQPTSLRLAQSTIRLLQFLLVLLLIGCANTTAVMPAASSKSGFEGAVYSGETVELDKRIPSMELYRVFRQGATGFVSVSSVRGSVDEIATQFCARKGKAVRPIQETASKPLHLPGNFPRVEWLFECADALPSPASTTAGSGPDKYSQIERLKKLLDNGALTQQEFEAEKAKVLGNSR